MGIILLTSCSQKDSEHIPENILSKEKMAALLTDVNMLEAALNLNLSSEMQVGNENREATMLAILKKNNVAKEVYDESFQFYAQHPELFSEVYKLTLSNLSELQAKVANEKDTVLAKDSLVKDSLVKDSAKIDSKKPLKPKKKVKPTP